MKLLKSCVSLVAGFLLVGSLLPSRAVASEMEEMPLITDSSIVVSKDENIGILEFNELSSQIMFNMYDSCCTYNLLGDDDAITGDIYENNDSRETATIGRYNKFTYANINKENDFDWYKIEVDDPSKPISIFLTDIPESCNYNLFLAQYDSEKDTYNTIASQRGGNVDEFLLGKVGVAGTYYVIVEPDSNWRNNYSPLNYTLYIGDYYKRSQFGYCDTGLSIDFGNIKKGNREPVYSKWYSYDLTNEVSIPDNAHVTKLWLTASGNGNYWIGLYKIVGAADQGYRFDDQMGNIDLIYTYSPQDPYTKVRQNWLIEGRILSSENFVWQPRIMIEYEYPATLENLSYLRH